MDLFDGILGHEIPKQFFANFISNPGVIPHALLLTGPEGVGKFALAFTFAKSFNCLESAKYGCECLHCRQVNMGTFSDVLISSSTSEIKAEQMRRLIGEVRITPRASTRRLVIMDDFERVNETAANIFLKTLEEPPEHLVFLLCTSRPDALLPTIQSRCIPIEFRTGNPSEIAAALRMVFPQAAGDLVEAIALTGCFGAAAREIHADFLLESKGEEKAGEEPYTLLLQAFVDKMLSTPDGEFAFHLKGILHTLISAVEGRWHLKQALPKGLDLKGLIQYRAGKLPLFSPVNYLIEDGDKSRKLGEYDKGRYLLRDLTRELYSRLTRLSTGNTELRKKLLQYLNLVRDIGADLEGNRNIELSFEKLLIGVAA